MKKVDMYPKRCLACEFMGMPGPILNGLHGWDLSNFIGDHWREETE
jgi:hypothetical protein